MKKNNRNVLGLLKIMAAPILLFLRIAPVAAQFTTITDSITDPTHYTVIPGIEYKRGSFHNFLWGKHYRAEWTTPVKVKILHIDTAFGGLKPLQRGGGRQTKSLRTEAKNGSQYVFRSVDKTYKKALPKEFSSTFVESVANDQISTAHPYASVTIAPLAEAAGVYHANPQLVFLAKDAGLGEYADFGSQMYFLEERPVGNEEEGESFGNAEDVVGTEKMLQKVFDKNDHRVDQNAFVRARLFDMFIADWGRHDDNWRWASFEEKKSKIYRPIPRDRDQAYTKFDGILVGLGTKAAQLVYVQSVDYTIKNISGYNFLARHLDRQLANEPSLKTWIAIATELQQSLNDQVIEKAVKLLPPEVYPISGPVLIQKLKSRRDQLVQFATDYYRVLAKEVEIAGTRQREVFEITGINNNEVSLKVFDQDSVGNRKEAPFYSRIFFANETSQIRLYGLDGRDKYFVTGQPINSIKIRIIGGPKRDSYDIDSLLSGKKVQIYDDKENLFHTSGNARLHLSGDSAIHMFNYNAQQKDFKGFRSLVSYTNEDRIFVGLGYRIQKQRWRKLPFGYQHDLEVHYSITQNAFSARYLGQFTELIGKWNLSLLANIDQVIDVNFLGIGNNTLLATQKRNYYMMRTREFYSGIGINRLLGKHHKVSITGFYQSVKISKDDGKFIVLTPPAFFSTAYYAGVRADYRFDNVNDRLFPSKGIAFTSVVDYTHNLREDKNVAHFGGSFGVYLPLAPSLTLALKTGAATLAGTPEFYQLNKLGGGATLRGFLRYRFYGKTSLYNQNELQWNFDVNSYLFNGKMGLLALLDNGRVWQPGEISDKWHVGVGGGLMLAPFNKISLTGTFTRSNEDNRINLRLGRLF